MESNRLLCDVDGTTADFMGEVYRQAELETGVKYCHADTVDYWFKDCKHASLFKEIIHRAGVFADLEPITGAVRGINRLRESYDVVFCTSPPEGSTTAENEKREWIARHFDLSMANEAIVVLDKSKVLGKVLIDDNPDMSQEASWSLIMFDQPWNRQVDLPRMSGWGDLGVAVEMMR